MKDRERLVPNPPLADRIIYRSGRFLLVNKLTGEASEGARPGMADLPAMLAALCALPGFPPPAPGETPVPPGAVQRLDLPVTGLCLFARTKEALADGSGQFRQGSTGKRYWAIVEMPEKPLPPEGTLVHWIEEDARRNRSRAFDEEAPDTGGRHSEAPGRARKRAELRYRLRGQGERYLFLEIGLLTGRRHQIRAQLEKIGLHIKGDLKYGARRSERGGGIRLHAAELSFFDGGPRCFSAPPLPQDRLWSAFMES